jgi:hypothetical protein
MAMTQKLWSINGLATELNMDRRTVAKKLAAVRPSGLLNGSPAWHLTVALEAIQGRRRRHDDEDRQDERSPIEQGMVIGHNAVVYYLPASIAASAVDCGLSMAKAYELAEKATLAAMKRTIDLAGEKVATAWLNPNGRSRLYDADCLAAIDWRSLAAQAGEPDWMPPQYSSAWPASPQGEG